MLRPLRLRSAVRSVSTASQPAAGADAIMPSASTITAIGVPRMPKARRAARSGSSAIGDLVADVAAGPGHRGELGRVHPSPLGELGQQRVAGGTAGVREHQHHAALGSAQVLEGDLLAPELSVMLMFTDPGCAPCNALSS